MITSTDDNRTVVRTGRGLSVAGTRITLYAILDYLRAGWTAKMVQQWFGLSDAQMDDVIRYIEAHREEVEKEYAEVLERSQESRQYSEDESRRRQLRDPADKTSHEDPRHEKLQAWKRKVSQE